MTWKQNKSRNPTLVLSKEALVMYEGFFLPLKIVFFNKVVSPTSDR